MKRLKNLFFLFFIALSVFALPVATLAQDEDEDEDMVASVVTHDENIQGDNIVLPTDNVTCFEAVPITGIYSCIHNCEGCILSTACVIREGKENIKTKISSPGTNTNKKSGRYKYLFKRTPQDLHLLT